MGNRVKMNAISVVDLHFRMITCAFLMFPTILNLNLNLLILHVMFMIHLLNLNLLTLHVKIPWTFLAVLNLNLNLLILHVMHILTLMISCTVLFLMVLILMLNLNLNLGLLTLHVLMIRVLNLNLLTLHVVHILPLIVVCTVLFLILNLNLKSFHVIEKEDLNFTHKTLEENNLNIQRTLDALDKNNLNLQNVDVLKTPKRQKQKTFRFPLFEKKKNKKTI